MHSIFTATSIKLFNFSVIFDFINYNISSVFSSDGEISTKNFVGLCDLCWQIKIVKQTSDVFTKEMDLLSHAAKKLLIKNEILEHKNVGFQKTLIAKQKR